MIDAHCHLDDLPAAEAGAAWERARAAGVSAVVLGGVAPAGWSRARAWAAAHPSCGWTMGVHPWQAAAPREDADPVDVLEARLAAGWRPDGIGEIGLDGRRDAPGGRAGLDRQEAAFRRQLRLARRHGLPVVLHVVRAHGRALAAVAEEGPPPAGGAVHAFAASPEVARRWLDLGFHLSFGGALTWPEARRARAAARVAPGDRLLVETDAPDLCPEPHRSAARARGEAPRSEPAMVVDVLAALAALRGEPPEALAAATAANARRLFGLPSAPR